MLTLEEMTDAAFDRYLEAAIAEYASEGARATGVPPSAAMDRARSQITALLYEGRRTPGQHLRSLVTETGEAVGTVWFADQLDADPPCVFLYDIRLDEARRGAGLGTLALDLLREEARGRGAAEIRLHVFTHNEAAIRLYQRLGYRVLHVGDGGAQMALRL